MSARTRSRSASPRRNTTNNTGDASAIVTAALSLPDDRFQSFCSSTAGTRDFCNKNDVLRMRQENIERETSRSSGARSPRGARSLSPKAGALRSRSPARSQRRDEELILTGDVDEDTRALASLDQDELNNIAENDDYVAAIVGTDEFRSRRNGSRSPPRNHMVRRNKGQKIGERERDALSKANRGLYLGDVEDGMREYGYHNRRNSGSDNDEFNGYSRSNNRRNYNRSYSGSDNDEMKERNERNYSRGYQGYDNDNMRGGYSYNRGYSGRDWRTVM